jgi:TM2 domain-containing membrane protein YozV
MRISLCLFLWGALVLFTSGKVNAANVPLDSAKHNKALQGIKIPDAHSEFAFSDSIKDTPKKVKFHKKHRLIAALLAFPLGVFGLHRMYLGTSAKIPLIYIVTIGGGFGILPFIDFVLILLNKDIHLNYTSNTHIFMWNKREMTNDSLIRK